MNEPQPKKGKRKWLIILLVAGAAALEAVGPAPVAPLLADLLRGVAAQPQLADPSGEPLDHEHPAK